MKKEIFCTQVRMPEELHKKVKKEADELGVSFNAHLMELVWLGMKVREIPYQVLPVPLSPEHQ